MPEMIAGVDEHTYPLADDDFNLVQLLLCLCVTLESRTRFLSTGSPSPFSSNSLPVEISYSYRWINTRATWQSLQ